MPQVGAYEAKTRLSQLLDRVAKGEEITITKHGVPVAVLAPVRRRSKKDIQAAIAAIEAFGSRHRLDGLSIRELIEEGRM
jgi:prevent-host-death family protein